MLVKASCAFPTFQDQNTTRYDDKTCRGFSSASGYTVDQEPVVQNWVSGNPGLKFNPLF